MNNKYIVNIFKNKINEFKFDSCTYIEFDSDINNIKYLVLNITMICGYKNQGVNIF